MNNRNELREVNLVIDRKDIMVKIFVAGIWKENSLYSGFFYSTGLPVDAVSAYTVKKIPLNTFLNKKTKQIEVKFIKPVGYGQKYSYELQLLLSSDFSTKIGNLNIIEWLKEDLGQITFLPNAGSIFFSSTLAEIVKDKKYNLRSIVPGKFSKRLKSHSGKSSAIRIEWGDPPIYRLFFNYSVRNKTSTSAYNFELKSYLPNNTKFQKVLANSLKDIQREKDDDKNTLLLYSIPKLGPQEKSDISFYIDVSPKGNVGVSLPDFGTEKDYRAINSPNSIGFSLTLPSKYWDYTNANIEELYIALKNASRDISEYICLAFEFVNQKIVYEMNGFRDSASNSLRERKGDCSEMSDLFVALLRAYKIPAKIIHGWVIDKENLRNKMPLKNQGHAWCEFFSPISKGWIQCDPTWGYLTGVSCQHICRQKEGLKPDQNTFSWKYRGNTTIEVEENINLSIL